MSVLCLKADVIITEFGAHLFYEGKWNERESLRAKRRGQALLEPKKNC